ncbi:MAG: family 10 glycosylhydrolase [Bacilli bacterium]|nr:family 10 glycosylhydrolase [Bacilli bacterium]
MKLKKYASEEYVYYYGNQEVVELPEYTYRDSDVRGVWVSNVVNIDTPKMVDVESYKQYLVDMIKNIASYNMNLIIFQVRPTNDAYYPSKLNPWSKYITGVEGRDPGFDVLQFVIDEAKKYNIQVHAWMNPYRVSTEALDKLEMTKEEYLNTLSENNFARLNPDCTILDGTNKVILKPASKKVIQFVTDTIMEVVDNYDVTGVHIDDYFYPYAKVPSELEEDDFNEAVKNGFVGTFDDWRRDNVNKMIKSVHEGLKKSFDKTGKKVMFGISPFGIYRTNSALDPNGWSEGSFHATGVCECYSSLYSDVYYWMEKGWIDYVVPQLYFPFERKDVNYHDLAAWWAKMAAKTNTTLYIGQAIYQMGSNEVWANPDEIDNQLCFNCLHDNIAGTIFFTYHDLVPGKNEVKDAGLAKLKARWVK